MTIEMAFASAIEDTSDDVFMDRLKKKPALVEEWINVYGIATPALRDQQGRNMKTSGKHMDGCKDDIETLRKGL